MSDTDKTQVISGEIEEIGGKCPRCRGTNFSYSTEKRFTEWDVGTFWVDCEDCGKFPVKYSKKNKAPMKNLMRDDTNTYMSVADALYGFLSVLFPDDDPFLK